MKRLPLKLAISAMLLSSCAPHIAGTEHPPAAISSQQVYYSTETVIGPCDSQAEALPLLPAIAATVVAQGVNRIGDIIKAAAATETKVVTARRNVELAQGEGLGPCITIARGWFFRHPPALESLIFYENRKSEWLNNEVGKIKPYWRNGLHMAATPDFYFQGRVVGSTDATTYAVLPVQAFLERPISSAILRGGDRSVLVSFAFVEAGKAVDLQKGGGSTILLGKMAPGQIMTFSEVSCFAHGKKGEALNMTVNCPEHGAFDILIRSPFESEWFSVSLSEKSKPLMVQALVSETRSASEFLSFVGDVFGGVKPQLTEELQQALIPAVGEDAIEADLTAKEKLENEADAAQAKAIAELKACIATPGDSARRLTARSALRSYVQAARKAERASLATSGMIDAISPSGADAVPCQSALNAVLAG